MLRLSMTIGLACVMSAGSVAASDLAGSEGLARRRTPVVEAYERARDAVVNISASQTVVVPGLGINFFGELVQVPTERSHRSVGSGFVIHRNGYVATNAHVIAQGADLRVIFADGREYDARPVARDTANDLAVIKIDADRPLPPISLGRSDDLMIGEQTIAVGNPVGLQNTVTTGVISALGRELEIDGKVVYHDVIQTDASINPGNSGGPLLNILGELIGVNTAVRGDAQNIGFAIPVEQLRDVLNDMLDAEEKRDFLVGVKVSDRGQIRVVEVREGSPAEQAGIRLGDVVESINNVPATSSVDFLVAMLEREVDDQVELSLRRGDEKVSAKMKLIKAPAADGRALARSLFGMVVADMPPARAQELGLKRQQLVIVTQVEPRSPADRAGIEPGDLLVYVGPHRISGVDKLGGILAKVHKDEPVDISVWRKTPRGFQEFIGRLYGR